MKILIIGFHPYHWSGLSKAGAMILRALCDLGHECQYMVIPKGGDHLGAGRLPQFNGTPCFMQAQTNYTQKALAEKYDLMISIGDLWYFDACYELTNAQAIPWAAYFGIEGLALPPISRVGKNEVIKNQTILDSVSKIWAYTRATVDALQRSSGINGVGSIGILPHYGEPKPYSIVGLKDKLRIPKDKKIALYVGGNYLRKGVDLWVQALKNSSNDWVGYMHMPAFDELGIDLRSLVPQLGLEGRLYCWDDLSPILNQREIPDMFVQGLYYECDLFFHPHRGEGFGLAIQDALMSPIRCAISAAGSGSELGINKKYLVKAERPCYVRAGGIQHQMQEMENIQSFDQYYKNAPKTNDWQPYTYQEFKDQVQFLLSDPIEPKLWRQFP
jgi:glycosyltransferase involved in cell wall biosynthesis